MSRLQRHPLTCLLIRGLLRHCAVQRQREVLLKWGDLGFTRPSFIGRQIHIPAVHTKGLNLIRLSEKMCERRGDKRGDVCPHVQESMFRFLHNILRERAHKARRQDKARPSCTWPQGKCAQLPKLCKFICDIWDYRFVLNRFTPFFSLNEGFKR